MSTSFLLRVVVTVVAGEQQQPTSRGWERGLDAWTQQQQAHAPELGQQGETTLLARPPPPPRRPVLSSYYFCFLYTTCTLSLLLLLPQLLINTRMRCI